MADSSFTGGDGLGGPLLGRAGMGPVAAELQKKAPPVVSALCTQVFGRHAPHWEAFELSVGLFLSFFGFTFLHPVVAARWDRGADIKTPLHRSFAFNSGNVTWGVYFCLL